MHKETRKEPQILSPLSLDGLVFAGLLVAEGVKQLVRLPSTLRDNYRFNQEVRINQIRCFGSYQPYSDRLF